MKIRPPLRLPAPRAVLAALAGALLAACSAGGPAPPVPDPVLEVVTGPVPSPLLTAGEPCLAALPDSVLTLRDTIYLHAFLVDTAARALLVQADLLAQRVAYRLRLLLGGRLDSLPSGEPAVTWRSQIGGNLSVQAHRDGRATWQELLPMPFPDTAPTRLVARALDSVLAHREMVDWTEAAPRESVEIRLALARTVEPSYARAIGAGFPVFTRRLPAVERPELLTHPPVNYPDEQRYAGVNGHVVLRVTIDAHGRPVPGSVRYVLPDSGLRPSGQELADYLAFARASREVLLGSRYLPGRIGGCAVSTTADVPFNYTVAPGHP